MGIREKVVENLPPFSLETERLTSLEAVPIIEE